MKIKRPMCILALIFMLAVWGFTYISGGIDLSEKAEDNTKIIVDGIVEDKAYKGISNVIYIKCLEDKRFGFTDFSCVYGNYNDADAESKRNSDNNIGTAASKRRFIVYLDKQDISDFRIGQTVRVEGKYSNFPVSENLGQFDMRMYYRLRGYEAKIKKADITHASSGCSVYKDFLYNIKERTKSIYRDNMCEEHYGTISAMVLGDKNDLDDDTKTLYQNAGISHILSLSGLHIATVGMFVFSMLIKAGLGNKLSSILSTFIMVSYGIMTGLSTSTFRALIMFFLGIFAKCIGRTYDLLSAVCVSAIIILVENPFYIYDSGFLMSFLSVIGIGIIYPVLNEITEGVFSGGKKRAEKLSRQKNKSNIYSVQREEGGITIFIRKLLNAVRQSICISLSATLATLPVVMNSFYKISRYSIFVNIVIVPAMSVVLFAGILGGITGYLGVATGYLGGNANFSGLHKITILILRLVEYILGIFNTVSDRAGKIPGNTWVTGKPESVGIVVYIIILVFAFSPAGRKVCVVVCEKFAVAIYEKKSHGINGRDIDDLNENGKRFDENGKQVVKSYIRLNKTGKRQKENHDKANTYDTKTTHNFQYVYFVYVFLSIIIAVFAILYRHKNDFQIDVLSVGQGACNVIHGDDIPTIMIDAGSSDVKEVGKYRVIPNLLANGIDEIDYLFVTHPDEDHISAVKELLRDDLSGIKVDTLIFSIVDDEILKLSEEFCVPVYSFNAGQVISGKKYEIMAVYPEYSDGMTWDEGDANEKSLVLKITHKPSGFTSLFTGDIGVTAENSILEGCYDMKPRDNYNAQNVDFMTIAHHGSKNSSSEHFLAYTNPLICTISAGKGNSYGHPHKETIEKLESMKIPYFITYDTGEINVSIDNNRAYVKRYLDGVNYND